MYVCVYIYIYIYREREIDIYVHTYDHIPSTFVLFRLRGWVLGAAGDFRGCLQSSQMQVSTFRSEGIKSQNQCILLASRCHSKAQSSLGLCPFLPDWVLETARTGCGGCWLGSCKGSGGWVLLGYMTADFYFDVEISIGNIRKLSHRPGTSSTSTLLSVVYYLFIIPTICYINIVLSYSLVCLIYYYRY